MIHAQINDWYRLRYKHYQTGEVVQHDFQVSQIVDPEGILREGEPKLYLWSRESGNMGNEQIMLGIDITGKILMKNDFEWDSQNQYFVRYGYSANSTYVEIYQEEDWHLYIKSKTCEITINIVYVDELQRALRLAGEDRLADEFKI